MIRILMWLTAPRHSLADVLVLLGSVALGGVEGLAVLVAGLMALAFIGWWVHDASERGEV